MPSTSATLLPPPTRAVPFTRRQETLLLLVYAACAVLYGLFHFYKSMHYHADVDSDFARHFAQNMDTSLADFQAKKPFQYRILFPLIAHGLHAGLRLPLAAAYQALEIAATLALLMAFRRYLGFFFPSVFSAFAPLALFYPLLWNYFILNPAFYPYDTPAIFFFVAGLVCLLGRRWTLYYVVFVLATLNRETSIFLVFAFVLIYFRALPLPRLAGHALAQSVIWLGIKALLAHLFAHNPGVTVFENQLHGNRVLLVSLLHGHLHVARFLVTVFGAVWLLIPLAWQRQPALFKRLLWLLVPFFVGMGIVGVLDEVRIYGEVIPLLVAPALFSLYDSFRGADERAAESGVEVRG